MLNRASCAEPALRRVISPHMPSCLSTHSGRAHHPALSCSCVPVRVGSIKPFINKQAGMLSVRGHTHASIKAASIKVDLKFQENMMVGHNCTHRFLIKQFFLNNCIQNSSRMWGQEKCLYSPKHTFLSQG